MSAVEPLSRDEPSSLVMEPQHIQPSDVSEGHHDAHDAQSKPSSSTVVPEVIVNGERVQPLPVASQLNGMEGEDSAWGSNFWVTLVDPQSGTAFFACPATGQVSWEAPIGTFVLPPNPEGEWWELSDQSRGGIPYYYQTKTSETVWERPEGFVIPLGIIQQTALGRQLSQTGVYSASGDVQPPSQGSTILDKSGNRRSRSFNSVDRETRRTSVRLADPDQIQPRPSQSSVRSSPGKLHTPSPSPAKKQPPTVRRSMTADQYQNSPPHTWSNGHQLPPIPGSPYATEGSVPPSPSASSRSSRKSMTGTPINGKSSNREKEKQASNGKAAHDDPSLSRSKSKASSYVPYRSPAPQSLNAAVELLSLSDTRIEINGNSAMSRPNTQHSRSEPANVRPATASPSKDTQTKRDIPPSPRRAIPMTPTAGGGFWSGRSVSAPLHAGKGISSPILNEEATLNMTPVKNRAAGKPIVVEARPKTSHAQVIPTKASSVKTWPTLPSDLAQDIQQFVESDYAKQYFSTHRTGFIFRRKVPVAQMMTWQKGPLASPLLSLNRSLRQDAVKIFKVIQRIMGDRERDRHSNARVYADNHTSTVTSINVGSTTSLVGNSSGLLEEERWLLGEGLTHGELRDEIYCQVMKQLSGNPSPESVFKGWQMLCVLLITFPPSKNFETYLRSFMQQRTTQTEGRVDVMAKHCLKRLSFISKKGPRGKPPTTAEIETASDAPFNPSTFGESLDATMRLQERNYPREKVPIILPFLADGILALGGTKSEGIFRVPGDSDSVSELKLRIDRGYYTLDGVSDPHVLASLLKLWLRELCDPLIPDEMYNDCITSAQDAQVCVELVKRLPTVNRRVVLFLVSFLQLFLEEKVCHVTKMTPANLALVMAPNLLRCSSESMAVVFTNAQFEQFFVYHLLLHLKCNEVDPDYIPVHGLGASLPTTPQGRMSKSRTRRQNY